MDFNTTHWTLVNQAAGNRAAGNGAMRREALQELLTRYLPALRAHLVRRKRLSPELADELLQGFVLKNILEGELIERADQTAGRFRGWLLRWLDTYVRHELNRNRREIAVAQMDDLHDGIGIDAFEIEWARATLQETLQTMQAQCEASGNQQRWQVFERRLVGPLLTDAEPADYGELVQSLGLESKAQVQNIMVTAKRQFERTLETVIGRYAESKEDITAEIAELRRILAAAKPVAQPEAADDAQEMPSMSPMRCAIDARPDQVVKFLDLDCAQVWQRCLATPICELLEDEADGADDFTTLGDLLTHEKPSRALLVKIKQFGNGQIQRTSAAISSEVGLAIYLAAIAAADVRLGQRISHSPAEVLSSGFLWLLDHEWIDDASRSLIEQAKAGLTMSN